MAVINHTVPSDYSKTCRLDSYIAGLPGGMNRSKLKTGVKSITINGKSQKISYKVKPGDNILIEWEDSVPEDIIAQPIPLEIIYEDKNVCVINKPQGMVTHPASGNWENTLVNGLLYHWGRENIKGIKEGSISQQLVKRRPGIVHRLDKDTSGIIITAKNRDSEEYLQKQFQNHKFLVKEYICICCGIPPKKHDTITTQIIRDPKDRKIFKAVTDSNEGKIAVSEYQCISTYGNYSLMRIRIKTGRTHQIRVHMKFINCPILGDPLYGKKDKQFPDATLMLHSRMLKIFIPDNKEKQMFKTSTPERFLKVEQKLKRMFPKCVL